MKNIMLTHSEREQIKAIIKNQPQISRDLVRYKASDYIVINEADLDGLVNKIALCIEEKKIRKDPFRLAKGLLNMSQKEYEKMRDYEG